MLLTLLGLTLLASAPSVPPSKCLTANGRTACGYSCRSSFSEVRCASTPYGTCATFHDRVYCFDPPASAIHHPPDEGLRPECKGIAGQAACGFNCLIAKGKVACARTPYGLCREHFNELKCFDPPEGSIHEYGASLPRPSCLTASTALGCGYDCQADRSEVKCASTPRGHCEKHDNQIGCFDPPILTQCAHSQLPDPEDVRKTRSQRQAEEQEKEKEKEER